MTKYILPLLLILCVPLMVIGCGEVAQPTGLDDPETLDKIIAEAVVLKTLQKRGKKGERLYYAPNEQTPYTGWMKVVGFNGQVILLAQCKDGKQEGPEIHWYSGGQKQWEGVCKDGKQEGITILYNMDGTESLRTTYKNGKRLGTVKVGR